jgi:hypothetical protein
MFSSRSYPKAREVSPQGPEKRNFSASLPYSALFFIKKNNAE